MEQVKIPIKTKIVIRLQDVISILLVLPIAFFFWAYFFGLSAAASPGGLGFLMYGVLLLLISIAFIMSGMLMLKGKRIGWWIAVVTHILSLAIWILLLLWLNSLFFVFVGIFIIVTLIILLLTDHRNFWKIAN